MALTSAGADSTRIYDELLVTTAEHILPGIRENAINASPIASIFCGKIGMALSGAIGADGSPSGSGTRMVSGESIRANVKLGKNESFQWLPSGYSETNIDMSDTARGSRANFKLGIGTVVISGSEKRKNSGAAQITSLLNHKETDTVSSMVDGVADAILSAVGVANAVTPLGSIISANDSLQGLSGGTFANWNSRGVSAKGTAAASISFASGSFATQGVADMRTAYMNAEEGSIRPKVIVTTDAIYRYYEGSLTPGVRFDDVGMGDIGFRALQFKSTPLFHDPRIATGVMYFLNTDFLFMAHLPGAMFDLTPAERGTNQDAFVANVLFEANLVCEARKYQNKLTGITA